MATRRAPLADVPNKINSPFKNAATVGGKRTRAADLKDTAYGQPPTKKQVIELLDNEVENVDPKKRGAVSVIAAAEPFASKRISNGQPSAFEKKLAAARERKPATQQRAETSQKGSVEYEQVRQWQRHYKRQFPSFVFYFDAVPDDVRHKAMKTIRALGATEEKFFSKAVTHVVTTRQIPAETVNHNAPATQNGHGRGDTISRGLQQAAVHHDVKKPTQLLDANLQRRTQSAGLQLSQVIEPKKTLTQSVDILHRARDLKIKIWALEKLQRVLKTLTEGDANMKATNQRTPADDEATWENTNALQQMIRNEKVLNSVDHDMAEFKGYYIYVHDMDEKYKPTMTRDYNRTAQKENGKWPQFRLSALGRCPFVEDPQHVKRIQLEEEVAKKETVETQRKTRNATAITQDRQPQALAECEPNLRRSPRKQSQDLKLSTAKPLDPPRLPPIRRQSSIDIDTPVGLYGSTQVQARGLPRMAGGQPIASGIQPSNVTSAIRSQAISSAAISSTAPTGRRIPDSKEVAALKRRVLERGPSNLSTQSVPSSYMNDMRAVLNQEREPPPRAAKRKAQETLGVVHEDEEMYQDEPCRRAQAKPAKRSKKLEKEPKPGYCENCHDKFDDFDQHIQSRKHRKFALTDSNWKELDALLSQLKRPHKEY
ncbi:hypothetical protein K431DRAFT_323662 [Polychaeton citri CBS 116435]|uniref:DBF4-type domain-containing protein n=1 Tax=Polychaeton citri CBS 116435 TaxID=1314669 RepID=A0A9P4Q1D5_9PEZI|nr:hypothetical protein K431DRAFT_323662 [Polychaeton citri CBS 116435]